MLEHILLTAAVLAGVFMLFMYDAGVDVLDSSKTYGNSRGLAEDLYLETQNLLSAQSDLNNYLTDLPAGSRENLLLDLKEVAEDAPITWTNTSGLAYYYEDLKNWSRGGLSYCDENIVECRGTDGSCVYFYLEDFREKLDSGELQPSFNSDWQQACMGWYLQQYGIQEEIQGEEWGTGEPLASAQKEFLLDILEPWTDKFNEWVRDLGEPSVRDREGQALYNIVGLQMEYTVLTEDFSPVGAENILEAVNASREWNGRLSEAYEALENAVFKVDSLEEQYAVRIRNYEEGNSNLTYFYADLDKKEVFTNKSDYKNLTDYSRAVEEMTKDGYYIVLYPVLAECSANISLQDFTLRTWQHMVEECCGYNDYVFVLKVDGEFPVMDDLAWKESIYSRFSGYGIPVIVTGAASVFLFFVCLIWLTAAAGRRAEDEEIHLIWFDRWYTELAAGTVVMVWGIAIGLGMEFLYRMDSWMNVEAAFVIAGIMSLCSAALFLTGYLSLVRRIKAGNLWKVSLCRLGWRWLVLLLKKCLVIWKALCRFCVRVFHMVTADLRTTAKAMLMFGGFALAQFVLVGLLYEESSAFLIPLVLLDGFSCLYVAGRAYGRECILNGLKRITDGDLQYKIPADRLRGEQKLIAEYINRIGDGLDAAVEESVRSERMKTELITNVSHDIKTPLTSIINYVDLLKRENIPDPKIQGYLEVLEAKAQRLKVLTEDVVEASKASTGSITLNMTDLDFVELVNQVAGEFQERFQEKRLTLLLRLGQEPVIIRADGQRMWRVLENIFNNAVKYAMEGTRVYTEVDRKEASMEFSLKNISAEPLNISPDELTERFIRGDVSRNTEGSGLGLSIARSLTELQAGTFQVYVDGDLFKVVITFVLAGVEQKEEGHARKETAGPAGDGEGTERSPAAGKAADPDERKRFRSGRQPGEASWFRKIRDLLRKWKAALVNGWERRKDAAKAKRNIHKQEKADRSRQMQTDMEQTVQKRESMEQIVQKRENTERNVQKREGMEQTVQKRENTENNVQKQESMEQTVQKWESTEHNIQKKESMEQTVQKQESMEQNMLKRESTEQNSQDSAEGKESV